MSTTARMVVVVGFLLHIAVGALVLVGGLIMPIGAVLALAVVWLVALGLAIRWRTRAGLVVAVPFGLLAIWLLTTWVGDAFFGWTA